MKKPMLLRLCAFVDADPEEPKEGGVSEAARTLGLLRMAVEEKLLADMPDGLVYSMAYADLADPEADLNCGRCVVCGHWTTDGTRPEPLLPLGLGGRVEGRLYCDEHLPSGEPGPLEEEVVRGGDTRKKPMLVRLSVVVDADPEDTDEGASEMHRYWLLLWETLNERLRAPDIANGEVLCMKYFEIDETRLNCGRCARCGSWTTDNERPDPILDLGIGARVDGQLYCDEDLPRDHPLAF